MSSYSYKFRGAFSCALLTYRKSESECLNFSMKNRRSVGAELNAKNKMKAISGDVGGVTTPVITACVSRIWKVRVCQKKKRKH